MSFFLQSWTADQHGVETVNAQTLTSGNPSLWSYHLFFDNSKKIDEGPTVLKWAKT
jgi:hypothetical protein